MVPLVVPRRRRRPVGRGGKARRKLHPLPILSNLEDLLACLPASGRERPGLLALDVSKRALGVAGADAGWRLATPLRTIRRKGLAQDLEQLKGVIRERVVGVLVLGWPLNMDGSEGARCQSVRAFAERLDAAFGLPILLVGRAPHHLRCRGGRGTGGPARQETRRSCWMRSPPRRFSRTA